MTTLLARVAKRLVALPMVISLPRPLEEISTTALALDRLPSMTSTTLATATLLYKLKRAEIQKQGCIMKRLHTNCIWLGTPTRLPI